MNKLHLAPVLVFACVFFLNRCESKAQTVVYKSDATAVTGNKGGWSYDWSAWLVDASGTYITSVGITYSSGYSSGNPALSGTVASVTRNSDFYIVVGYSSNGLWGGSGKTYIKWISAYQVGGSEPQSSSSGGYNGSNPTDANGAPADPVAGTSTPPASHRKTLTFSNTTATAQWYEVEVKNATTSQVVGRHRVFVPPQTSNKTVELVYPFTFTYSVRAMVQVSSGDNSGDGSNMMASGSPVMSGNSDNSQNPMPTTPTGDSLFGTGGGMLGANSGTISSGEPTAAGNQTRPGTTEGNADARNQELRDEIKRGVTQTKASGDQVSNSVGASADKLDNTLQGIKNTLSGAAGFDGVNPGTGSENGNATSWASGSQGRATSMGQALTNAKTALGIGGSVSTASLTWSVEFPAPFGTQSISLESYAGEIAKIRQFLVWFVGLCMITGLIYDVKGAFAGQ